MEKFNFLFDKTLCCVIPPEEWQSEKVWDCNFLKDAFTNQNYNRTCYDAKKYPQGRLLLINLKEARHRTCCNPKCNKVLVPGKDLISAKSFPTNIVLDGKFLIIQAIYCAGNKNCEEIVKNFVLIRSSQISGPTRSTTVSKQGFMCQYCSKLLKHIKICGGCRISRYCSRKCQKCAWPHHKSACKESQKKLLDTELNSNNCETKPRELELSFVRTEPSANSKP